MIYQPRREEKPKAPSALYYIIYYYSYQPTSHLLTNPTMRVSQQAIANPLVLQLVLLLLTSSSVSAARTRVVGGSEVRIIGGDEVDTSDFYQYDWFATIQNGCGGSLIYPDVVLTAAHCSIEMTDKVYMGHPDYTKSPFHFSIVDMQTHPEYDDEKGKKYDFRLLKLDHVEPSILPVTMNVNSSIPVSGDTLRVLGHGWQDEYGSSGASNVLRQVDVDYIDNCLDPQYLYHLPGFYLDDNLHICAGGEGKDACKGMLLSVSVLCVCCVLLLLFLPVSPVLKPASNESRQHSCDPRWTYSLRVVG